MKNKHFYYVLLSYLFILTTTMIVDSCRHQIHPCDPEAYYWSLRTKSYYESAPSEEFISLPLNKQRALYSKLSPEKRYDLWLSKLERVKKDETLSQREYAEYASLIKSLSPKLLSNGYEEQAEVLAERWAQKMKEQYQWDDLKIIEYGHSWLTKTEIREAVILQSLMGRIREEPDTEAVDTVIIDTLVQCDCISDNACVIMVGSPDCRTFGNVCEETDRGCGFWGNRPCYGRCMF
ncbi:MAG: bacteriocin fulvocin C-related protein [Bacteroidales bacterium]|nr:bacteriocin fulvocin C-related protein [Bacteroidales bacterium]